MTTLHHLDWAFGRKVVKAASCRKITDQVNLKSLQDHKQWWESLTNCLALGLDCSHIFLQVYSFWASLSRVLFLCVQLLSQAQAAAFSAGALCCWKSSPRLLLVNAVSRGRGSKRIPDMKEARTLNTMDMLRRIYDMIKGGSVCRRGDFRRMGAEKSPCTWCWLDLTRKKPEFW